MGRIRLIHSGNQFIFIFLPRESGAYGFCVQSASTHVQACVIGYSVVMATKDELPIIGMGLTGFSSPPRAERP